MNERRQAIALLKQARDLLADRLAEELLAQKDAILEDAGGFSYGGEIGAIYERYGARLTQLNQLLSNMPAPPKEPPTDDDNQPAQTSKPLSKSRALPAPSAKGEPIALPGPHLGDASFQVFAVAIQRGDIQTAARQLAGLLRIDGERAKRCSQVFAQRLAEDAEFALKAMRLRKEIESGANNGAIRMLYECFGLSGLESIGAVHALRERFDPSQNQAGE